MLASIFCKYLHIFLDGRLIHTIFWGFSLKTATILKISISVLNATDLTVSKNGERKNLNIPNWHLGIWMIVSIDMMVNLGYRNTLKNRLSLLWPSCNSNCHRLKMLLFSSRQMAIYVPFTKVIVIWMPLLNQNRSIKIYLFFFENIQHSPPNPVISWLKMECKWLLIPLITFIRIAYPARAPN